MSDCLNARNAARVLLLVAPLIAGAAAPAPAGRSVRVLEPTAAFAEPAISPDRSEIAFVSGGDIWTVPAAGGPARLLVSHAANESRPLYSPDGARLAFTLQTEVAGVYAVAELASGEVVRLGDVSASGGAAWSPDGDRLAIPTQDPNGPAVTQVVELASGRIVGEIEGGAPAWRPAG